MFVCPETQSSSVMSSKTAPPTMLSQDMKGVVTMEEPSRSPPPSSASSSSLMSSTGSVCSTEDDCSSLSSSTRTTTSTSTTGRRRRRKIRFSKNCKMYLVPHLNTYSDEELSACWWDETDYRKIRNESLLHHQQQQTSHHQRRDGPANDVREGDNDEICKQDEEKEVLIDQKVLKRRVKNRIRASNLVFCEQEDQWKVRLFDEERIRCCYRQITEKCADDAHRTALIDAAEAMLYLRKTN